MGVHTQSGPLSLPKYGGRAPVSAKIMGVRDGGTPLNLSLYIYLCFIFIILYFYLFIYCYYYYHHYYFFC